MPLPRPLRLVFTMLLWLVTVVIALALIDAGWGKFESADGWRYWFTQFGYPGWFAPAIGGAEMLLGAMLLWPRLSAYAGVGLIGIMVVAWYSVLTTPHTDLSSFDPVFNMVLIGIVTAGFWRQRFRLPLLKR